ncbi:MAG: hypothetical protein IKD51_03455 [Lactococcus sp.]|nr:hypothetical protein [Lactococcus sp.]
MTNANTQNKRKSRLILAALLATIVIITGSIFAFFSDVVNHDTTITAGTLDLVKGTTEIYQNGANVTTAVGNNNGIVENFNPGDVVTFSVPIKNEGSKSAWLRGNLAITGGAVAPIADASDTSTFADNFIVFSGSVAQSAAAGEVGGDKDLSKISKNWTFDTTSATFVDSEPGIINGNNKADDFEAEAGAAYTAGTDANEGTLTYTIYFKPTAKNKWQGKDISIDFKAQAIQYRNNTTSTSWTDVVSTEYGVK